MTFPSRGWQPTTTRAALLGAAFFAGVAAHDVVVTDARADVSQRYPYDPVCAWGRIADGNGMLVRCLAESEANQLVASAPPAPTPAAKPGTAAPAPTDAAPAKPAVVEAPKRVITAEFGPVEVDTGTLPLATKKLGAAKSKFVECVEKNGGMSGSSAEVQVKFLVRERGRAEGVSLGKFKGVSRAAGSCVAHVVDRREVGYPEADVVGASVTLRFAAK